MPGPTREYGAIGGIETSEIQDPATPTNPFDTIHKEYADDTYAKLQYWGDAVADNTALKAVASADRSDKQARVKDDDKTIWVFDASSSATEDGTTILQPNSGTGRWLKASGSSGGGSGSASSVEMLQTQNELAGMGFPTRALDNSIRASGLEVPAHKYFTSYLIENYTSGGASIKCVHNPVVVFDSDKDYDSITGWAAGGAGTTLAATAGSTKVGSNHFSFNKDSSAVDAYITHSLAAQTLNVGANFRLYFWLDLPSVVNLSNVYVQIMGATTSDFSRWNLATDYSGASLTTGYQLFFVDIKNTAASSTGGTAWTTSQLARYVRFGVTTSSAAQTYTGIKFAGAWFSHGDVEQWAPKYLEFTGYDTSNKNDFVVASSNTRLDGPLTLGATVAQNYTAGIAAAAAMKLVRSTLSWSQAGLIGFDTALSSGTIATEQEMRMVRTLRESLSGNYGIFVDMFDPQIYKVSSTGSGTILVADSENHIANLKNGDEIHIFTTTWNAGEPSFTLLATRTMSADATHSSGTTTLTVTNTGVVAGDFVVKKRLSVSHSVVASSANESFSASSLDTAPNGVQLIGSRSYPYPNNVYAHWWLGGPSETLALKDQTGNNRGLTKVGSPNLSDSFRSGKYSYSGVTTGAYLRTASSTIDRYEGDSELVQISIWVYFDATLGSARNIMSAYHYDGANEYGWIARIPSGASTVALEYYTPGTGSTGALTTSSALVSSSWNHIVLQIQESVYKNIWINGTKYTGTGTAIGSVSGFTNASYIGVVANTLDGGITGPGTNLKYADCIVWRDGALLTQSDVNYLYNGGVPQFIGYNPAVLRNEFAMTGQSGQRISMKAKMNRTTTAVSPSILNAGMIKTG